MHTAQNLRARCRRWRAEGKRCTGSQIRALLDEALSADRHKGRARRSKRRKVHDLQDGRSSREARVEPRAAGNVCTQLRAGDEACTFLSPLPALQFQRRLVAFARTLRECRALAGPRGSKRRQWTVVARRRARTSVLGESRARSHAHSREGSQARPRAALPVVQAPRVMHASARHRMRDRARHRMPVRASDCARAGKNSWTHEREDVGTRGLAGSRARCELESPEPRARRRPRQDVAWHVNR
jgi:hypothetical protein